MNRQQIERAMRAIELLDFIGKHVFARTTSSMPMRYRGNGLGSPELRLTQEENAVMLRGLYDYSVAVLSALRVTYSFGAKQ